MTQVHGRQRLKCVIEVHAEDLLVVGIDGHSGSPTYKAVVDVRKPVFRQLVAKAHVEPGLVEVFGVRAGRFRAVVVKQTSAERPIADEDPREIVAQGEELHKIRLVAGGGLEARAEAVGEKAVQLVRDGEVEIRVARIAGVERVVVLDRKSVV